MKKTIFTAFTLLALSITTFTGQASASEDLIRNTSSSALNHFNLDSFFQIEKSEGLGGQVALNESTKSVSLIVQWAPVCKPGTACPHFIRQVINASELPIVSVTIGDCQERTIVAEQDLRSVDGNLQTITIVDNSKNNCNYYIALPAVEVTYQTAGFNRAEGKSEDTLSKFTGKQFQQLFFMHQE